MTFNLIPLTIFFLQDLESDLESELSGDFRKVILGLMMTLPEYDAYSVKTAVKGLGTDENALIEVLCSRTNQELEAAKEAYRKSVCNPLPPSFYQSYS